MTQKHTREPTDTSSDVSKEDILSPQNDSHSLDVLFRALEKQECRLTCYYLGQREGTMPIVELAKLIAASTQDKAPSMLTTDEIARTRASLTTHHLPKLEAAGLVRCDGPFVSLADDQSPSQIWLETTFDLEIE